MRMRFSRRSIIDPLELQELISTGVEVRLIDASWGSQPVYPYKHIHNAVTFDIDAVADVNNPLPHMLPDENTFADSVGIMGINNQDTIVVYDQHGIHLAASRVWWMFRFFGHKEVYVLNGGLPYWEHLGLPVNDLPVVFDKSEYKALLRSDLVADGKEVLQALDNEKIDVIDVRSADRFLGMAPEPRVGMRSGHMPNSKNQFFVDLMDQSTLGLKSEEELEQILSPYKNTSRLIASCGSGVTACVFALGMYDIYEKDVAVYDGSWSEWGQESSDFPVAL
ncbi:MAG TPA: sulfurtransferase [Micavibrio sp.]|nr:sulfurtransferase [Micavibrio sp.]HIL27828.1 sulfurtransferase [Micavibrio sp.]